MSTDYFSASGFSKLYFKEELEGYDGKRCPRL